MQWTFALFETQVDVENTTFNFNLIGIYYCFYVKSVFLGMHNIFTIIWNIIVNISSPPIFVSYL